VKQGYRHQKQTT